jgi:hypothetical protein
VRGGTTPSSTANKVDNVDECRSAVADARRTLSNAEDACSQPDCS